MSLNNGLRLLLFGLVLLVHATPAAAQQDAPRTRSPHGRLEIPCQNCHASDSWKPIRAEPDFNHNQQTRFPLSGQHTSVACASCHVQPVFANTAQTCASCHADFHRRQFGASCENCHTVKGWRVQIEAVQHHANRFPLVGAHSVAACESCHRGAASGVFTGLGTACVSCHSQDYQSARSIDHRSAGFATTCETCHNLNQWRGARFDHNTATRFTLRGAHTAVQCSSCHVGGSFKGTASDCFSCHAADFNRTTNPDHRNAGFPTSCQSCHTDLEWRNALFDHSIARFPLTGAHTAASCQQCHAGGQFTGTPQTCVACHSREYEATAAPDHAAASFSRECAGCHTTSSWHGAQFDHNRSRFPLTGKHTAATCASCHEGNRFSGTPAICASCHSRDYEATRNPDHVAAAIPRTCESCHTTATWLGAKFDHNAGTRFPLTGAHVNVLCTTCHVNGRFAGTPQTCIGCHAAAFNRTTNPNHAAAGFPQDCTTCHTTTTWTGARFDHNARTRFALTGSHVALLCVQCHAGNRFAGTPQDCASCHNPLYERTTNPNHVAAAFPRDCALCHATSGWRPATFDHSRTRFPLTGAHTSATCLSCHVSGRYAGLATSCVSCHINRYNSTTSPNHAAAGFPQDCALCHGTSAWRPASFDHSRTRFPLTGAHTSATCASCHSSSQYAGLSTTCVSCHLNRYNSTTAPNHVAAGFPQDCQLCHTTSQWRGAVFDHNRTRFALTGGHTTVQCANCHIGNRYAGTPTDCFSCHSREFNTVTNPNHVAAGFPKTCATCHTTTTWTGARFTHRFPIYSGSHSGKWTTCNDCHTNTSNYTVFSCLNCHAHERTKMNEKHREERGYVYESLSCYGCHPTGKH
jgi:hypothetical protein